MGPMAGPLLPVSQSSTHTTCVAIMLRDRAAFYFMVFVLSLAPSGGMGFRPRNVTKETPRLCDDKKMTEPLGRAARFLHQKVDGSGLWFAEVS